MSRNVAAGPPATAEGGANPSALIPPTEGGEPRWEEITPFLKRYGRAFMGTARRYSSCRQDAEDAYQRAVEILITHSPAMAGRINPAWMHTVVRNEALRQGRQRRRLGLAYEDPDEESPFEKGGGADAAASDHADPADIADLRDQFGRFRQAFRRLKRSEQRALCLIGEGYSYSEITEITGWSYTKTNRHLSEGRARMREMLERIESGHRCAELAGPLSRYCDGQAAPDEVEELRDHLEQCLACRSTLRQYRALPRQAVALFPVLPAAPTLGERLQELGAWLQAGLPGRSGLGDAALLASGNGAGGRGNGMAALAKLAILCAGAGGGTAACVASGVLPAPSLGVIERAVNPSQAESEAPERAATPATPPLPVPTGEGSTTSPSTDSSAAETEATESGGRTEELDLPEPTPQEAEFGIEAGGSPIGAGAAPAATASSSTAGESASAAGGGGSSPATPEPVSPHTRPPVTGGDGEFGP